MADYIDRQAAIEALRRAEALTRAFGYHNVIETVREMPSADVEPVRHGRWMFSPDDAKGVCSLCHYKINGRPYQGKYLIVPYNYCPNCGTRMDGEQDG